MSNKFIKCPGCGKDWAAKSGSFPAHAKTFQCPDCYYAIPIPDYYTRHKSPLDEDKKGESGKFNWLFKLFRFSKKKKVSTQDLDLKKAKTVVIGEQVWMIENLNVDHYRNGDPIPEVRDQREWRALRTGAWCYYDNDPVGGAFYGKFYNWYAVNDPRGLGPTGWHIPSDAEWQTLVDHLGGDAVAGGKMKEVGTSHWESPNTGATNESGFSALPGGYRSHTGSFLDVGLRAIFWSSMEGSRNTVWTRDLRYLYSAVHRYYNGFRPGFSVRFVRD